MKYRVVGWTSYDDSSVSDQEGTIGYAECCAIIDEIKKHGYLFTGWDHQEGLGCAPVLNDGKRRCFSQRAWGGIMAEAHGQTGPYDYARFTFLESIASESKRLPRDDFDPEGFIPEEDLAEQFSLTLPKALFDAVKVSDELTLEDDPTLRYLNAGDTLILLCEGKTVCVSVKDVDRAHTPTEEACGATVTIKYDL